MNNVVNETPVDSDMELFANVSISAENVWKMPNMRFRAQCLVVYQTPLSGMYCSRWPECQETFVIIDK